MYPHKTLHVAIVCVVLGLVASPVLAGNVTLTVSADNYTIVELDDGQQIIRMEGFGNLSAPGKPGLPAKIFMVALPPGAEVTSVTVTGMSAEELSGTYRIKPIPPMLPADDKGELIDTLVREWKENRDATYSSDHIYPEEVGEYLGTGGLRKYTFARIRFCPFAYRPASGRLLFYPSATVSIDYLLPAPGSRRALEIDRLLSDVKADEQASCLLFNYSEAKSWYATTSPRSVNLATYDYVIITTEALQSSVTYLVNWKHALGYSVNVVTTAWISSRYAGFDLVEKVRNFLIDTYAEWGIEYVLLVGDIEDVPMRLCYPRLEDHGWGIPTDYYYADLTGDWDSDGDGFYGESDWNNSQDDVDLVPEVYVGRIPWSEPATVAHICQKLADFEGDTGPWKQRALLLGAILNYENECDWGSARTCGCRLMEKMITDMLTGWTYHTMYEKEGLRPCTTSCTAALSRANVMSYWSAGQYGIVNWFAHGSYLCCQTKCWESDDGDGIPESNRCPPDETTADEFVHRDHVTSLDDSHPSIIFAASCGNGEPEHNNLARELLKHGSAGIIAATRIVVYRYGWSDESDGQLPSHDYYFFHYLINEGEKVGNALFDSHLYIYNNVNIGSTLNTYPICLYGDPSLVREGVGGVEVFPDIQFSAASHDFGDVLVGQSLDWTVTISNMGQADLLVDASDFSHPDFRVTLPGSFPQTVLSGSDLDVTVTFTPSSVGSVSGRMTVHSNDPDQPTSTVSVAGRGMGPEMHVTPAILDETVVEGGTMTTELAIANHGTHELTFHITETIDWLEVDPSSGTVDPDGVHPVEVAIDARSLSPGAHTGEMTIETNDAANPVRTLLVFLNVEAIRVIVSVGTTSALPGAPANVLIDVDNLSWLPASLASIDAEIGFDESLLTYIDAIPAGRTQSMSTFACSTIGPGAIALSISDTTGRVIVSGTGAVAEISFAVSSTAALHDSAAVSVLGLLVTDEEGDALPSESVDGMISFGLRGDVNDDMQVDIIDALLVVNIVLDIMIPTGSEKWAADCNGDGVVTIIDVLGIVNVVLGLATCSP